jgi:hypothetical protein
MDSDRHAQLVKKCKAWKTREECEGAMSKLLDFIVKLREEKMIMTGEQDKLRKSLSGVVLCGSAKEKVIAEMTCAINRIGDDIRELEDLHFHMETEKKRVDDSVVVDVSRSKRAKMSGLLGL